MIDRPSPPANGAAAAQPAVASGEVPAAVPGTGGRGLAIGRFAITPGRVAVALAFIVVLAYCGYVVAAVKDGQISLLVYGMIALGAVFAVVAIRSLLAMWQAASWARGGRALGMAIVGGVAGLAAIGCFAVGAVLYLVATS